MGSKYQTKRFDRWNEGLPRPSQSQWYTAESWKSVRRRTSWTCMVCTSQPTRHAQHFLLMCSALCQDGFTLTSSLVCTQCSSDSAAYRVPFSIICAIILLGLLYWFGIRPLRRQQDTVNSEATTAQTKLVKLKVLILEPLMACTRELKPALMPIGRAISHVATTWFRLTMNNDPYAAKAFAKPEVVKGVVHQLEHCVIIIQVANTKP